MIELLLKLTILVWPFGQLLSFRSYQHQTIYLLDFCALVLTIALLSNNKARKIVLSSKSNFYLFAFILICFISLLVNLPFLQINQSIKASFYLLRLLTYPSIYFAAKTVEIVKIRSTIIAAITLFIFFGLAQYLFIPDTTGLKYLGFDDHYYRLIGTLFDPNFTGEILAVISLALLIKKQYLLSIFVLPLMALTYSRATYLTYIICLFVYVLKSKKYVLLVPLLLIPLSILLSPRPWGEGVNLSRTFSIYSRIDSLKDGVALFIERPLLGWGFNTLSDLYGQRIAIDNSYVFLLATTGLSGFIAFMFFIVKKLKIIRESYLLIPIITILVHSLFNNSLFYIWIFATFWLMLGIAENKLGSKY